MPTVSPSSGRLGPSFLVAAAGGAIPGPSTRAMLIAGFGLAGSVLRPRRMAPVSA